MLLICNLEKYLLKVDLYSLKNRKRQGYTRL